MAAGKDGVQPGATWCRAECCLGALGRFGQDGQVWILPFSVWFMLFFSGDLLQSCCFCTLPMTLDKKDSYSRGKTEYSGEKGPWPTGVLCMSSQEPVSTCWKTNLFLFTDLWCLTTGSQLHQCPSSAGICLQTPSTTPISSSRWVSPASQLWDGFGQGENVWSNNRDCEVSNLARIWQWRRDEVRKAGWHLQLLQLPSFRDACMREAMGRLCTFNSPCCYPSLVHLKGREEELSSRSGYYDLSDQTWIFVVSEGPPPSSEQTPDTSVMQLKYVSWHERLILPCWAVLDLSLQRKLSSRGKISDMVKPLRCWRFTGFISHLYLCAVGGKVRGNYNAAQ